MKKQYGRRVSIDELRLLAKQQKPSTKRRQVGMVVRRPDARLVHQVKR